LYYFTQTWKIALLVTEDVVNTQLVSTQEAALTVPVMLDTPVMALPAQVSQTYTCDIIQ